MPTLTKSELTRRGFITAAGLGVGALLSGKFDNLLSNQNMDSIDFDTTLDHLLASLSPTQAAHVIKPWNNPTRQITNTIAVHKVPHIGTLFNAQQQVLIQSLYNKMLSKQGHAWMHNTITLEGKLQGSTFTVYTDNSTDRTRRQSVINGGHHMIRRGGESLSGSPLGGPVSYGQQIGNNNYKVRGNAYKAHGDAMHEFHSSLNSVERKQAYLLSPPSELLIQPLGFSHKLPGLKIANTSNATQETAVELIATLLSAYTPEQQAKAYLALEQAGGINELHVSLFSDYSFYQNGSTHQLDKSNDATSYTQIWRIEGPNMVLHFQGYPHVHAYLNIIDNADMALIGERIAETSQLLEGESIRNLLVRSMKAATDTQFAYYPEKTHGRIVAGDISAGSVFSIDPYNENISVVELRPSQMSNTLKKFLIKQGANLDADQAIRIACNDYALDYTNQIGKPEQVERSNIKLRSAMIAHLKQHA